ncbi:MAG: prepilin-type N-terminal cleavage/methylation domain-containing protein [Candidatus Saccharibacteria bacterium]|nr:prepilin-type N-terminal cleavage/methylation domain-containing protein [Candidatus Saccharibacteria bacterium]
MRRRLSFGYTIIELVVVVAIIGVLAAIIIVGYSSVQQGARNSQRSTGLVAVSEALEKYYNQNGDYPACAAIVSPQTPTQVVTNTLVGLDPTDLTSPTDTTGTNSFACGDPATPAKYGYVGGSTTFSLKYKEEGGGLKVAAVARHTVPSSNFTLALKLDPANPNGSVSGSGTFPSYVPGATPTITATPNAWYSFDLWTGSASDCYTPNTASHSVTMSAYKTCVAKFKVTPVTAPSTPTVSQNTVGATTTWSWGAASCSGGNTPEYKYDYTITPAGFDSGWVGTGTPSVALTTSTEGQTYDIAVQARCANPVTTSAWSASSVSSPYYRTVTTPTISATPTSGTCIDVSWPVNSFAISYTMDRSLSSSFTSPTTITQAGTTYSSCGLAQGTTYYFRVKTSAGGGSSAYSTTANATTLVDTPTPNPPTISNNGPGDGTSTIWTFSGETCGSGATLQYQYLYDYGQASPAWVTTAATTVTFTTSTEDVTYKVTVQARCYVGAIYSSWTSSSTISTYYRPIPMCTLTVIGGTGGGSYDCGVTPATPTITATPNAHYHFTSWTGTAGCVGSGTASHTITMASPSMTCTANSALDTYVLTVNSAGNGSASGGGTYDWNTPHNITATPNANYHFTSWTGSGCTGGGTQNPSITVTGTITCTANFAIDTYVLTVNSSGNGTASGSGTFDYNSSHTITATPNTYYQFNSWSGTGCAGIQSHSVTITGTMTCTANFSVQDTTPVQPTVSVDYTSGPNTYFIWSATCASGSIVEYQWYPNAAPWVYLGSGIVGLGLSTLTVNTYYDVSVQARCYNASIPYTSGWSQSGVAEYYRDYWWAGNYSGAPAWVYYQYDGTLRRYKTANTANASPQSVGGSLVSPQTNPGVDFSAYPAQNNCKAIGGRTPTPGELSAIYNSVNANGSNFYHDGLDTSAGNRSNQEYSTDKTYAVNRNMSTNSAAVSLKDNNNPIRCVKD